MTQQKKQKTWLTTYLVSFILLHNVSLITNHDRGRAEKHGRNADKVTTPHCRILFNMADCNCAVQKSLAVWYKADNVKQYHLGANIFLAYFHYCNKVRADLHSRSGAADVILCHMGNVPRERMLTYLDRRVLTLFRTIARPRTCRISPN